MHTFVAFQWNTTDFPIHLNNRLHVLLLIYSIYENNCYTHTEASRGANATGRGFELHSRQININIFFISSIRCRVKARRRVPTLNTQCLNNSVESGERERSVLTLDSNDTLLFAK